METITYLPGFRDLQFIVLNIIHSYPVFLSTGLVSIFLVKWLSTEKLSTKKIIFTALIPLCVIFVVLVSLDILQYIIPFIFGGVSGDGLGETAIALLLTPVVAIAVQGILLKRLVGLKISRGVVVSLVNIIIAALLLWFY